MYFRKCRKPKSYYKEILDIRKQKKQLNLKISNIRKSISPQMRYKTKD